MSAEVQKIVIQTERVEKNSGKKIEPTHRPCPPPPKQKIKTK